MPRVLYLSTIPPPAILGTEAVLQTIDSLMQAHSGEHLSLFPFQTPSRFVPACLMGWRQKATLSNMASKADLIHVFNATLRPLHCLNGLSRPIVYTVTATVGKRIPTRWLRRHNITVVVNNARDNKQLEAVDGIRTTCIRPGLDLSRFSYHQPPSETPFKLLIGSAPWTRAQFKTKGIDALIRVAHQLPWLHLVFLWRNLWLPELEQRIDQAGLRERVTIHNTQVDVNGILADCHATAILAANNRLVKAWPHSGIESLAAGKPLVISDTIAMADYIEKERAGITISTINEDSLSTSLQSLRSGSDVMMGEHLTCSARDDFGLAGMLQAYQETYATIC